MAYRPGSISIAEKVSEMGIRDRITHYFLYFRGKYSPNLLFEALFSDGTLGYRQKFSRN